MYLMGWSYPNSHDPKIIQNSSFKSSPHTKIVVLTENITIRQSRGKIRLRSGRSKYDNSHLKFS